MSKDGGEVKDLHATVGIEAGLALNYSAEATTVDLVLPRDSYSTYGGNIGDRVPDSIGCEGGELLVLDWRGACWSFTDS